MLKLKIPPVVVFFICIGLMWWIHNQFTNDWLLFEFNVWITISLLVIGGGIALSGVVEFIQRSTTVNPHKPENTKEFVRSGAYKFSRNPMYLGLLVVLLSPVFYWGNAVTLIMLPLFIWYLNEFQIKPEEEIMKEKFGDEFKEYEEKVRRWV